MPSRPAQRWIVRRNGRVDDALQVLRIEESAGGGLCDLAELIVDPAQAPRLQDFDPLTALGDIIEIEAVGGGAFHFGEVTQHVPIISSQGETIKYISRIEPHHFGEPAGGVLVYAPGMPGLHASGWLAQPFGGFKRVDDPIVFNPEVDGLTFGNMHDSIRYGVGQMNVFLDRESVRTAPARTLQQGHLATWELSDVVHYLCWALNGAQIVVDNPTRAECEAVFGDADEVRDYKIDDGEYLPEVLDRLLQPRGYRWHVAKSRDRRRIKFFRRGTGRAVTLKHQRQGSTLDSQKSSMVSESLVFDATRLANKIIGRGSKLQIEITAELVRAWPEALDDYDRDELTKAAIAADGGETPDLMFAWRKWALNENGDYVGMRDGIDGLFTPAVRAALQAAGLMDWMIPRRRRLLPALTQWPDEDSPVGLSSAGVELEYRDASGAWLPVTGWGIDNLNHEAGILIVSKDIPEELIDAGDAAAVRVTATIETDFRITATAERRADSPIGFDATAQLELAGDYHWRVVSPLSKYAGSGRPTLERDDREALNRHVATLRELADQLDVAGPIVFEGVDQHDYQVGDMVSGIEGRNVSFRSRQAGDSFPQVVGRTYDVEGQRTILHLERMRETVAVG